MNAFISQLDIQAFRGIRNLDLENLANVNVLVGANNSGKTSVLEAIRFLSNPQYTYLYKNRSNYEFCFFACTNKQGA